LRSSYSACDLEFGVWQARPCRADRDAKLLGCLIAGIPPSIAAAGRHPASMVNQKHTDLGIPNRLNLIPSRSSPGLALTRALLTLWRRRRDDGRGPPGDEGAGHRAGAADDIPQAIGARHGRDGSLNSRVDVIEIVHEFGGFD
jgi:hypothetical protein